MQHRKFSKKTEINVGETIIDANDSLLQTVSGYTRKKGLNLGVV